MFSTVTDKGQITLPVSLRRSLGITPGRRVAIRQSEGVIVVEPPPSLAQLRSQVRTEMDAAGTWGTVPQADGVWAQAATERATPQHG
jgi:AbrB family looped-hinge helix DNA binding protein